ncbi:hypothetical protein [Micromonospora sp. NPDC049891]|uniref:hypothetical protein n=1 Tax=Micromonospora sp. NPDC049891 TaxID=3155655 RepID=UPI0033FA2900
MSSLGDLERAGMVAAAMAAAVHGKPVTYDPRGGWTTRHDRTDTKTGGDRDGGK